MRLLRLLVAVLFGVATGGVLVQAPAQAVACAPGTGVTVVVNGSIRCDPDGGGVALNNFRDAGHALRYATQAPGFVCRVDGAPASDPCTVASPSDAYWGLFWSDGTSGTWTYASLGVASLRVPTGGSVAFIFQSSASRTWPSVSPPVRAAEPAPKPGGGGSAPPSKEKPRRSAPPKAGGPPARTAPNRPGATTAPTSPTPSSPSASTEPTDGPSASPSTTTPPTKAPASDDATVAGSAGTTSDGLVTVADADEQDGTSPAAAVAAGLVVVVLAAAGALVWRRRREP